jgi:hypothetical protein
MSKGRPHTFKGILTKSKFQAATRRPPMCVSMCADEFSPLAADTTSIATMKRFQFAAAAELPESDSPATNLDFDVGRIVVKVCHIVKGARKAGTGDKHRIFDAANAQAPKLGDGKKWFLGPSLHATDGPVAQKQMHWSKHHWAKVQATSFVHVRLYARIATVHDHYAASWCLRLGTGYACLPYVPAASDLCSTDIMFAIHIIIPYFQWCTSSITVATVRTYARRRCRCSAKAGPTQPPCPLLHAPEMHILVAAADAGCWLVRLSTQ